MHNLLKAEFYKLRNSKLLQLSILMMVIQAVSIPFLYNGLKEKSGKGIFLFAFSSQDFLLLIMTIGCFIYFIAGEFSIGCIRNLVAYGHKRRNILISKSISYYVGVVIISCIFPIVITIINTVMNGYGESFTVYSLMFLLRVALLKILVYVAMASIGVMVAFISRNASIAIVLTILLDPINRMGREIAVNKSGFVTTIYEKTIFGQSEISTMDKISLSQGMQVVLIALGTILISTLVSLYFFNKGDIK